MESNADALPLDASPPSVDISIVHPEFRVDERKILRLVACICAGEHVLLRELSIVLADHATIRHLNRTYLNHDYDTDVLSFPLNDDEQESIVDGEVYIDLDTASERHAEFSVTFEEESLRYIAHGVLHLIGYRDDTPGSKEHMHALENRYLNQVL